MSCLLIATLGAEPQVVSLATELLLRRGAALTEVVIVHTDAHRPPIRQALSRLQEIFAAQPHWPPLQTVQAPVADTLTPQELDLFGDTLYQTLQCWLQRRVHIHLLLAGGRKSMAMVGMSVAQLLLGPEDAVWYLYSDEALRRSRRMTLAPGDHAQLVAVPLPHPTLAPPHLTPTGQAPTRAAALAAVDAQRAAQAHHFLHQVLTPAERRLAMLLATEVLTVGEAAARLSKSPKTITNQLTAIYSKLESSFGLQPDPGVKREFLRRELAPYLAANEPVRERQI
ncbi:MAG TPA: CRISPR-associated ring nuclease [Caldilineaceae bacterium]|nr:CRISPR-associated ring nuclease [Caldilineaceae bacterium]